MNESDISVDAADNLKLSVVVPGKPGVLTWRQARVLIADQHLDTYDAVLRKLVWRDIEVCQIESVLVILDAESQESAFILKLTHVDADAICYRAWLGENRQLLLRVQ